MFNNPGFHLAEPAVSTDGKAYGGMFSRRGQTVRVTALEAAEHPTQPPVSNISKYLSLSIVTTLTGPRAVPARKTLKVYFPGGIGLAKGKKAPSHVNSHSMVQLCPGGSIEKAS